MNNQEDEIIIDPAKQPITYPGFEYSAYALSANEQRLPNHCREPLFVSLYLPCTLLS